MSLAQKYQKKTELEAILSTPDMYLSSTEPTLDAEWVLEEDKIIKKEIKYIPALRQLFEEALVNTRDHYIRCSKSEAREQVSFIHIDIDKELGKFTFSNDGEQIDVAEHPEEKIYIPELIFGTLRTSTNYEKNRTTGGAYGLGIKLVNIWSKQFEVKIQDKARGLTYTQTFRENMSIAEKPVIKTRAVKTSLVQISFIPDYERFGARLDDDLLALFERRIADLAAFTEKVQLKYNGRAFKRKDFKSYTTFYTSSSILSISEHWKIAVFRADSFTHLSFVNGICTKDGGTHVDFVIAKIIEAVRAQLKVKIKPQYIKDQLFILLSCNVVDPRFNSQIKGKLTSRAESFFPLQLEEIFITKIFKLVKDKAIALNSVHLEQKEDKETKKLARETDGTKTNTIKGIPTLVDANHAGGRYSDKCILVVCEGNSASTGIRSGLSSEDRNTIGIYPIRGKLANLRNVSTKTILENKVVLDIKKILGLKADAIYQASDIKKLRYGKIVFMTDQDLDGQHIKALALNMFHVLWPSLLKIPHFVGFIQTPIIKARNARETLCFYRQNDYEQWVTQTRPGKSWNIKYYKGLGTSVSSEFKEYMKQLKIVYFTYKNQECDESFEKVFEKKNADLRKLWLYDYDEKSRADIDSDVSFSDFINKELIHFSKYDCDRSIPAFDGLKISQRKILYSAFKKGLKNEIKVAQFCGYVAEQTSYHHGEESLNKAIIGMAQNFVGSNNINLLEPEGQFGSRVMGGDDSASPRYIFTRLNPITRLIFREEDDPVLDYIVDDGKSVEPKYYVPIIPMVLVNGALGIGTGFSSEFLPHCPSDIIDYLLDYLEDEEPEKLLPWFRGFKGKITECAPNKYKASGLFEIKDDKVVITELPIGTWTQSYKEFLEKLHESGIINSYSDLSTEKEVLFTVQFEKGAPSPAVVEKTLKLSAPLSETNMHIFNARNKLVKYDTIDKLIDDYVLVRLDLYEKRRQYMLNKLAEALKILKNKIAYLRGILDLSIRIIGPKKEIELILERAGLERIESSYNYLLDMKFSSLSEEELNLLQNKYDKLTLERDNLLNTTPKKMWKKELLELDEKLDA